jgi:hypothetical protein
VDHHKETNGALIPMAELNRVSPYSAFVVLLIVETSLCGFYCIC